MYFIGRSIVVANFEETIKMPLNEPAPGKRKSQIQGSMLNKLYYALHLVYLSVSVVDLFCLIGSVQDTEME
jgi:hypothetical protein